MHKISYSTYFDSSEERWDNIYRTKKFKFEKCYARSVKVTLTIDILNDPFSKLSHYASFFDNKTTIQYKDNIYDYNIRTALY